ncbi:hypothetical protein KCU88_g370, partial [Aureobasidium melanogenum]
MFRFSGPYIVNAFNRYSLDKKLFFFRLLLLQLGVSFHLAHSRIGVARLIQLKPSPRKTSLHRTLQVLYGTLLALLLALALLVPTCTCLFIFGFGRVVDSLVLVDMRRISIASLGLAAFRRQRYWHRKRIRML